MQKLSRISLCFIVITMVVACRKDKSNPILLPNTANGNSSNTDCYNYVYTGGEVIQGTMTTGDQYTRPCFNPNNSDEFVYVKKNHDNYPFKIQLIKHAISTGQEQVLCDGIAIVNDQPQWGKQGWIIFSVGTAPPLVIWKIREDGTGLAQVTPSNLNCFAPRFNVTGDKFIHGGEAIKYPYLCIYDLNGNIVDSVRYNYDTIATGFMCPFNDNFKNGYYTYGDLTTSSPQVMGIGKLQNDLGIERLNVINFPNGGGEVLSMCQNNQAVFYVQYWLGLYRLDKATHQTTLVMQNCQSKYIAPDGLSMSPNGQNILYERIKGHQIVPGGGGIDEQSEIFLYNIATGQEVKIIGEE